MNIICAVSMCLDAFMCLFMYVCVREKEMETEKKEFMS